MARPMGLAWGILAAVALLAGPAFAQGIPDDAMTLFRKGLDLQKAGKRRAAIKAYEAGLRQADLPKNRTVAQVQYNLAVLLKDEGHYARAEKLFLDSLAIREKVLPPGDLNIAWSCYMLGLVYRDTWHFKRSEQFFKRGLEIRKAVKGKPGVAQSLLGLATLYDTMSDYRRAEPIIEEALALATQQRGPRHGFVGEVLLAQAGIYRGMGKYDRAIVQLRRALEIYEETNGKDHLDTALALNNLGVLYLETRQFDRAEQMHRRALKIRSTLPDKHPARGQSFNNLAEVYRSQGEYERALPLFRRALRIYEEVFGPTHPLTSQTINNLGSTLLGLGQWQEAEKYLRQSLGNIERQLPPEHTDFVTRLHNLSLLYFAADRVDEAVKMADRERRLVRRHVSRLLPVLSEREQLAYLRDQDSRRLRIVLSGGVRAADNLAAREKSAAWLLNAKALAHQTLAESALLARDSKSPKLGKLTAQLVSVRQRLARLTLDQPSPARAKQARQQVEELSEQEQDLSIQLRKLGSTAVGGTWAELVEARRGLPRGGVLIDVIRFPVFNPKAKPGKAWSEPRYLAWLTTREGKVSLADLGPAEAIDAAVKETRQALASALPLVRKEGEARAEKALREPLEKLSKLVLRPLLPHVGQSTDWVISPDGDLWLAPWEALLLPDGKYAIEKHRVCYLTSGRDLLRRGAAKGRVSAPLVLADPDFDLDPNKAGGDSKPVPGRVDRDTRSGAPTLGKVPRLPGTAAEAKAITPSLRACAKQEPLVLTGRRALKSAVLATRRPRLLVLCTHGFFLPEPPDEKAERAGTRNPLLRCGVLLAGCNRAGQAATSATDGVLTGLEVVGLDLRGCELVVLSACDTGVGKVQTGEGVSGLRQAFQLAGAQAVVSTLWQVPDRASSRLMSQFFNNLSRGMSKPEALRAAKRKLIEERREDYAAAHPFFWAAFTLTGQ